MPVHLLQRLHVHPGLRHVEHEVRQPLVLRYVPVRARQQQPPLRVMGAGGPHLLAVDDPVAPVEVRSGGRAGQVGSAARLAEQLAPRVLAGEDAAQELFLVQLAAVLEQRGGRQQPDAGLRHAHRVDGRQLVVHDRRHAHGQAPAVPLSGPVGHAPARVHQGVAPLEQPEPRIPMGLQPGPNLVTDFVLVELAHRQFPQTSQRCRYNSRW